ncbi:hypothetical protein [Altibacter sp. HG106]|uniref:hypothetical protein n=1 Tax=Altibacter sp. HG106 TaxID=3023937 RepID=UPI002350E4F5|nr:hypothetical protein [Altibacter sp. HG106]MDC7996044.1 hypothetical protein [Altibacter sp. HG106]
MKYAVLLVMLALCWACQKEEFTVIQDQEDTEEVSNASANLRLKLRTVSSHDGSFDDVIDNASCVSIKLPYTLFFNGELYNIGTILDLQPIGPEDEVELIFPLTLVRSDHSEIIVTSEAQWEDELSVCGADTLIQEHNPCVDIAYPISLAIYNVAEGQFETRVIANSQELFPWVVDPQSEDLISINYPVDLIVGASSVLTTNNNNQLADTIDALANSCD